MSPELITFKLPGEALALGLLVGAERYCGRAPGFIRSQYSLQPRPGRHSMVTSLGACRALLAGKTIPSARRYDLFNAGRSTRKPKAGIGATWRRIEPVNGARQSFDTGAASAVECGDPVRRRQDGLRRR